MCGFQSLTISRNHKLALEYFTRAEEVLKWGSNLWEKVSTKDRGVVFEKTFIRAVCRMRLKAMYEVSKIPHAAASLFMKDGSAFSIVHRVKRTVLSLSMTSSSTAKN